MEAVHRAVIELASARALRGVIHGVAAIHVAAFTACTVGCAAAGVGCVAGGFTAK